MSEPSVPPWAPTIWRDASTIWLSFPAIPGQAAGVMAFSLTEGGLSKALKAIRSLPTAPDPRILGATRSASRLGVKSPRVTVARKKDEFDPGLRAGARDVLRRLKMGA